MNRSAWWTSWRRQVSAAAWALGMALLLALAPNQADAQAIRAFSARYSANINGDIAQIGNTVMHCNAANTTDGTSCANGQAGIGGDVNNNSFAMVYVDVDGDAFGPTFNSSSANLTSIPAGAVIKFAGLYWGGVSASAARNQMLFKLPGAGGYTTITASQVDGSNINVNNNYAAFADVTSLVAGATGGNGTYFGANVQSETVANRWGAWALVIVYESNTKPLRNLVVFDGYVNIINATGETISLSGFLTPYNGPVNTQVGSFGFDGDKSATGFGATGDALQVRSGTNPYTTISDALNPGNNFFNSSMTDGGVAVTARNPAYSFNFGVDLDRFTLPAGVIGNAATNADLLLNTGGEQYLQVVVTWMTDLYVPIIAQNLIKTVTDLNGGNIMVGDTLRWNISMFNSGLDTGVNLTLIDPIPPTVTYVPGSLVITSSPAPSTSGGMTDAIADDRADFRTGPNRVVFRLGNGAGPGVPGNDQANGGSLAFSQFTSLQFDTTVNPVSAGTVISNSATIYYSGQTLTGTNFSSSSSATSATVMGAPTIAKVFNPSNIAAGGTSQLKITVGNPAANPSNLTGVTFLDSYPTGVTNTATPAPNITCTAGSSPGTLVGGTPGPGNTIGMNPGATLLPGGSCDITVNVTAALAGTYVNSSGPVAATNATSGAAVSATLSVGKLSVAKSFTPSTIQAGQAASLSITITNPLGTAITGAYLVDNFPANLVLAAIPGPNPSPPCGAANAGIGAAASVLVDQAGGTLTAGDTGIALPGGTIGGNIAANSSCTFAVSVTGTTATTFGLFNNTTGAATRSGDVTAGNPSNTATLTIVGAPTVTKNVTPRVMNTGDTATVSITLTNPNTTTTITRAGTAFTDTYPAGMTNLAVASGGQIVTSNCTAGSSTSIVGGVAGGSTLGMSAVSLAPLGSCTVTSVVVVTASGNNNTGAVTFDNAPSTVGATVNYTVTALVEPTVTKSFSSTAVSAGSAVTMTIVLTNPVGNGTSAVTGSAFVDTFPLGMVNTSGVTTIAPASCSATGGTATVSSGALTVSGLNVPGVAPRTCTITTTVAASTPGFYFNTTGPVTSTVTPPQNVPGTASLATYRGLQVTKAFTPNSVALGGAVSLSITISNPSGNPGAISASTIVDAFPTGMLSSTGATVTNCPGATVDNNVGVVGANAFGNGSAAIRLSNASVAIGTPCVITINAVRAYVPGNLVNTIGVVSSSRSVNGNFPTNVIGTGGSDTLSVGKVGIAKAFSPSTISSGNTSTLTFTLSNGTAVAVSGINFTDLLTSLPTRQITLASGTVGGTCTGVASNAASGGTSFIVTAGNVPANGSCTITVQVTSSVTGAHPNQTTGVTHATDATPGAASNIATLTVTPPPTVLKSFLPTSVGQGQASTLSVTISNLNGFPVTNVALTDTFPAGLVVASPFFSSNGCGGTLLDSGGGALGVGDVGFQLSGATVATNSSCVIAIRVSAATAGAYVNTIPAGALTSNSGANPNATADTLNVLLPLTAVKSFTPNAIAANGTSVLLVRLTNPNAIAVTGAGFTDNYPANLNNTASPAGATSCPGGAVTAAASGTSLALSGATVPANNFCDITVNVTSAVNGVRTNPAFNVATTNAGAVSTGAATLAVGGPSITKSFTPNPLAPGGVSTISFVITNPTAVAMTTNVGFTDTFPAGMTLAYAPVTPQCGGTLYVPAGTTTPPPAGSLGVRLGNSDLTGGTVAANSSCTVLVAVTTPTAGVRVNTTGAVTSGALVGNTGTDTLTTFTPPTVSKSFAPPVVGVNQASVMTIRIDNPNAFAMSGAALTDTYPANMVNSASPAGATTCAGGTVAATGGVGSSSLSGATVPASSFCVMTVNVVATTAGAYVNTLPIGAVTTTNAGSSAAIATGGLTVLAPPTVQKDFNTGINYNFVPLTGTTMPTNTPTQMRIRLTNPSSTIAITGAAFSDAYPAGLINSTPPNATISGAGCSGVISATAGGTSLDLSGLTIPVSTTCSVTVNVQSAISNFYTNNTGPVSTGNAGTGVSTAGAIYVMAPLLAAKSFTPSAVSSSAIVSNLQITLINPNPYPVTGGAFTDNYTAVGIVNAAVPNGQITGAGCAGTVTAVAAASTLTLANGTVPANSTCVVSVNIRATVVGDSVNSSGAIVTANAGTTAQVFGTINQGAANSIPPSLTKTFTPSAIAVNALSTLSFVVTNPITVGVAVTNVAFSDTLPGGIVVATPANATNTCGGAWSATAGSSVLGLTAGSIPNNSSCTLTVQVTGNTAGIYNNVTGQVSGSTGIGNTAIATLSILDPPDVVKSFTPAIISQGGVSTISFVITNSGAAAATNLAFTDTLTNMTIVNPPAASVTGAGCTGFTVTAPNGGSLISVSGGTVPARVGAVPGTCTISVQVTSVLAGVWPNATSQTTSSAGTGSGSNSATLTVNAVNVAVSGYVFIDANANGTRNPAEDWTSGVLVYVNIVSGGVVVQSQAVNPGTGLFNFPSVPFGTYTIIVSNSPVNATPVIPSGFSATSPTTAAWNLPITGAVPPVVDFGFTGPALSQVSGRVFRDTGFGSASPATLANNGILDAGEGGSSPGLSGVTVAVTDCASTTFATTTTDGGGNYTLRFPSTATNVCIVETNLAGYLSTGASQNITALTASTCATPPGGGVFEYDRSNDRICFAKTGGTNVNFSALNFGDVPVNTFVTDQKQQTTPGNFVLYPHVFTYETAGSVTFGTAVVATNPNIVGWSEVLYRDSDCDGRLDAAEPILSPATTVTVTAAAPPGNKICVILKEFTPPAAPFGAQRTARVDATFVYTNANPGLSATYSRTDVTTVEDKSASGLKLVKEVCNESTSTCTDTSIDTSSLAGNGNYGTANTASSGNVLRYRIIYSNTGSGAVSNVVINDTTPPFTGYASSSCPAGPACTITTVPGVCTPGPTATCAISWALTGTLPSGGQGIVVYRVTVQ